MHPLVRGGRGLAALVAAATAAGAATASAANLASWATRTCYVVPRCTTTFCGTMTPRTLLTHLARAHTLASVPRVWVTAMRLGCCRYCGRPYRTPLDGRRQTSLRRHEVRCAHRPAPESETDTDEPLAPRAAARGAPSHVGGDDDAPMAGATDDQVANATGDLAADALGDQAVDKLADQAAGAAARPPTTTNPATLFFRERSRWERRRASFLLVQAPTPDARPSLVASGARTADRVPASALPAWQQQGADALSWARREPGNATAWLWLLTRSSLPLHVPAPTRGRGEGPAPRTHAARAAAIVEGKVSAALRDRNVGVWRDPPGSSGPPAAPVAPEAPPSALPPDSPVALRSPRAASATARIPSLVRRGFPFRSTSTRVHLNRVQRRALRQVWRGRLSAATRTLQGAPAAPHTRAAWRVAQRLFPRAAPGLATTASVEAEFGPELDAAAAHGAAGGYPVGLVGGNRGVDHSVCRARLRPRPFESAYGAPVGSCGGRSARTNGGCAAAGVGRRDVAGADGGRPCTGGSGAPPAGQVGDSRCGRGAQDPPNRDARDAAQARHWLAGPRPARFGGVAHGTAPDRHRCIQRVRAPLARVEGPAGGGA